MAALSPIGLIIFRGVLPEEEEQLKKATVLPRSRGKDWEARKSESQQVDDEAEDDGSTEAEAE